MSVRPFIVVAAVFARDWIAVRPGDRPRISPGELRRFLRCGIDALDIRVESLRRGPSEHERALADVARAVGLRVRCHAWVGVRDLATGASAATRETGLVQGAQLAAAGHALGAESAAANAERDVWRGVGRHANPRGAEVLDGLAEGFHGSTSTLHLDHVGFGDPAWHYGTSDVDGDGRLDAEIPEDVELRYRLSMVMAYGSSVPDIETRLGRAKAVWQHHAAEHIEPWLGPGRIDKRDGQVGSAWASAEIIRRYRRGCLYVGGGAMGQLLVGHPGHMSIEMLVRAIREEHLHELGS